MDLQKNAKELAEGFKKYRRLQKKMGKLKVKKADPKNVKPMIKVMKDINGLLNQMDVMADKVLTGSKKESEVTNA